MTGPSSTSDSSSDPTADSPAHSGDEPGAESGVHAVPVVADATPAGEPVVVDARGLRCPIPAIRLARRAQALAPGDLVTVWSTDPAAVYDVPAWARMRGHAIDGSVDVDAPEGPFTAITVRVGG